VPERGGVAYPSERGTTLRRLLVRSGDKGVHKVKDVDKVNGVDQVNGGVGDGVRWWGGSGGRWRDSDALDVPSTVTLLTSLTLWSLAAAHKARVT
jgi:hypothetical protein